MNEFPSAYYQVFRKIQTQGVVAMNGSEYLEFIKQTGLQEISFIPVQPVSQHKIWERVTEYSPDACNLAIQKIQETDPRFNPDGGSWTNDRSWVLGYENVLDPINALSVKFHRRFDSGKLNHQNRKYQEALLYLLLSQTSCFRYWGQGAWTGYAQEICRRGMAVLEE